MKDKDIALINKPEKLRLVCRNCNTEWTEVRPKGYYVRCERGNNFLVDRRNPEKIKYFRCPECNAKKNIGRLSVGIRLSLT